MRKFIVVALALCALGIAACGGTTQSHTTTVTKVADVKPVAPAKPKLDLTLCTKTRTDVLALISDLKTASSSSEANAEAEIGTMVTPDVYTVQADVAQARDEATTSADVRALDGMSTALGTMQGGLTDAATGDYTGISMVSQGVGQLSAAVAGHVLDLCGGTGGSE